MKNEKQFNATIVNKVVNIAKERQAILAKAMQEGETTKLHELAWQNESNLAHSAGLLERELKGGIRELTQALSDLRKNNTGSLNSSGILQNTNTAIDRGVTEVKEKMSKRLFYRELFKD